MKIEQIWQDLITEKVIGKGSYGTVYKCYRENNGEKEYSAVKVISIPQTGEEYYGYNTEGMTIEQTKEYYRDIVDDFTNEIKILESLKGNKNIVEIKNYEVIEKTEEIGWEIFIEMELLTDFNSYACDKTFTEDEVLKLGIDLCNALYVCNEKNIIHRDIKPENIFVSDTGDFKLGDFGVSRQLEKTDASMSRKGTFNYMAPEVFYSKKYDSRADVYSLGLVMYKLLNNNRMPFLDAEKQIIKYSERQEAFDKRINGEKIPAIKGISDELNEVILKACEYKTEDRYNNAEEFRKTLEKRKLTGVSGWVYRHKKALWAAVAFSVVLSVSVSVVLALKLGNGDKNILDVIEDGITDLFYSDTMVSGKDYTSEAVEGKYIYASKNGVFAFDEATEKTTQLYDKASNGPAYDGGKIAFISDEKTAIYQTELESETPEKIFSSEELSLSEVLFFDSECIVATSSKTEGEETSYDLVFIDVASSTYEQLAELGDDTYAVYTNGNIVYLKSAENGTSGCEMYAYNIGNRESILLAEDAFAEEGFAKLFEGQLNYLSKADEKSELKVMTCSLDAQTSEEVTKEIKSCKDVIWWDSSNVIYVNENDKVNIYNIAEDKVTEVKEKVEEVYTYDGKYYAFEKFDDGYRLNEVRPDGSIKASMYTDNIKNKFDVIMLKKDKFLSWNTDSATVASVKTNGIDPLLVEPTADDWKKLEEEDLERLLNAINLKNYDYKNVDSKTFLLSYILENCGASDIYAHYFDDEIYFAYKEKPDPKKRFKYYPNSSETSENGEYTGSYIKLSHEKVKWIASNIFNVDFEEVKDLIVKPDEYENGIYEYSPTDQDPYFENGYYYFHIGDGGDGWIVDWLTIDKTYHADGKVSLKVDMDGGGCGDSADSKEIITFTTQVGLKCIDNKNYWSVYTLQTDASISDLERLEHLENEVTEKDVVYPNNEADYCELIQDDYGNVIGVRAYIVGDYTENEFEDYEADYHTCAEVNVWFSENNEEVWHMDYYNYGTLAVSKASWTYEASDVSEVPAVWYYDPSNKNYAEDSYEYANKVLVQNNEGYSTVDFMFDQPYSYDEFSRVKVRFVSGMLSNNEKEFQNYEFYDDTFG